jgi:hypothetical protein
MNVKTRAQRAALRSAAAALDAAAQQQTKNSTPNPNPNKTGFQYPHDAFRETHELMDSLIASYQAGCKDDTDAVREAARMVEDAIAAAAAREGAAAAAVRGAFDICCGFLFT